MKREYYSNHSDVLDKDMSMIVYGEGGYPVIAFQAQDAKSNNFEDFGMIDALAPFIEEGRIQVFSVDNNDEESWSDQGGDNGARAWRQEEYFRFVTDELLPRVHSWNNSDLRPLAVGCSIGATHAALAVFRRPDLFQGCIALSGVYGTSFFFGDWMDENLYNNDLPAFLGNMPADHPYVDLYNQRQLVFCVGQGAWEEGIDDLRRIDDELSRLGVNHWCDFWGTDVNHDWPWWRKQMPYFMSEVLSDIDAQQAPAPAVEQAKAEEPTTEVAEKPKATPKKPAAKRATTRKAAATKTTTAKAKTAATTKAATKATKTTKASSASAKATSEAAAAPKSASKTTARKATTAKAATAKGATAKAATKATASKTTGKAATTKGTAAKKATAKSAATETSSKAAASKATKATATKATASKSSKAAASKATAAKKTTTRRTAKKADAAE